ncbi:MAG: hypothetical protein IKE34_12410, partial [Paenibacillus sp.]|nr:hypothetical protein [Paenibacillus sp.]
EELNSEEQHKYDFSPSIHACHPLSTASAIITWQDSSLTVPSLSPVTAANPSLSRQNSPIAMGELFYQSVNV